MDICHVAKNNLFLAPMAGITDSAFRSLCVRYGAGLAYTEMTSAKGIEYGNKHTEDLLYIRPEEGRVGVQLFGNEPGIMARASETLLRKYREKIALFDLNMGCPAPKIVNNGEGCALMRDPVLAGRIIEAVKKSVDVPVTVKFRKGFEENIAVSFAKMCESAGADAVTVHGRTREQYYAGQADLSVIAEVKNAVSIPVIGNGDVTGGPSAKNMFEKTGCDALMVARGALGNPFIFEEIRAYLETGQIKETGPKLKFETAMLHARLVCRQKGERIGIAEMRKHAAWYVKGLHNAARLRERAVRVGTLAELEAFFLECIEYSVK